MAEAKESRRQMGAARRAITLAPVVVGALNWGLVGLFNVDLVKKLTGNHRGIRRLVYTGVGAAGAYTLYRTVRPGS